MTSRPSSQKFGTTIFDLHGPTNRMPRLRQDSTRRSLSTRQRHLHITTQFIGPLSVVGDELAGHAEAVVREAVGNAVQHAHASKLHVAVTVDDQLRIEVSDDGGDYPGALYKTV